MLPGMINLACTNVPGPLIPLYGTGHRMLDFYPMLPLAGDMGLGVAIMSYDQSLYWGISSDPKIVPDVDAIGRLIDDELRALRDAAGVPATDLPAQIGARQAPPPQTKTARKSPSRTAPIGSANRKRKTATSAAPTSARKQSAPNAPSRGRTATSTRSARQAKTATEQHAAPAQSGSNGRASEAPAASAKSLRPTRTSATGDGTRKQSAPNGRSREEAAAAAKSASKPSRAASERTSSRQVKTEASSR
jgi:hypothetical protein